MIQFASKQDADDILPLLLSAIGNIAFTLSGTEDPDETYRTLKHFYLREDNRLSYNNVLVCRKDDKAAGMLLCYAGDVAAALDYPIAAYLSEIGAEKQKQQLVTEARPGDFYLDSIAVKANMQGRGVARELMSAFEQIGSERQFARLSLIVEPGNERAYNLYKKQGYQEDDHMIVSGKTYIRMIKPLE